MTTNHISATCSNCGRPQVTPFCEWCGMPRADITLPGRVCVVCGQFTPSADGDAHCDECGAYLGGAPTAQLWCDETYEGGVCPRCGHLTELECRFCDECGEALHDPQGQPFALPYDVPICVVWCMTVCSL